MQFSKTEQELTAQGIEWPEIIHGDGGVKPTFFRFMGHKILVTRVDGLKIKWQAEWQGIKSSSIIPDEALAARRIVMSMMGQFIKLQVTETDQLIDWTHSLPRTCPFEDAPIWGEYVVPCDR